MEKLIFFELTVIFNDLIEQFAIQSLITYKVSRWCEFNMFQYCSFVPKLFRIFIDFLQIFIMIKLEKANIFFKVFYHFIIIIFKKCSANFLRRHHNCMLQSRMPTTCKSFFRCSKYFVLFLIYLSTYSPSLLLFTI